ncbi:hypothetical protein FRB90_002267 [Tulasnella sp. 427]|nr:hypothetical protein FRB90_002267 [Tulasnella sp. 427]
MGPDSPDQAHAKPPQTKTKTRGSRSAQASTTVNSNANSGPSAYAATATLDNNKPKPTEGVEIIPSVEEPVVVLQHEARRLRPVLYSEKNFRIDLRHNKYKYIESIAVLESQSKPEITIHHLSLECLRMIVLEATPNPSTSSAKGYQQALYNFIGVCRRWRDVAVRTRWLWAHLMNGMTSGMLDACILRSVGLSITVRFEGAIECPIDVRDAFNRFVDNTIQRRNDWRSVRFTDLPPTWESVVTVDRALMGPKPRLFSATITTIHGTTIPRLHRLRFNSASLRHFTVTGFIPDLADNSTFPNLETLRIRQPKGVSPSSLVVLLARNKKLRSLELEDVRVLSGHLFKEPDTFELPELAQFKLHLLQHETAEMTQIFTRLRAPSCKKLELTLDMDNLAELEQSFKDFKDCVEAFLIQLGTWLSGWMTLDGGGMKSNDRWLESAAEGAWNKSIFYWKLQGSSNGNHRNLSAEIRFHADRVSTKGIISRWAEDVKLYVEEEAVKRSLLESVEPVELNYGQSFRSFRRNALRERELGAVDAARMGIWDLRRRYETLF